MSTMRTRLGAAAALLTAVAFAAPVSAGQPDMDGAGPHSDDTPYHWILDAPGAPPEYAPVVCRYNASSEELIRLLIRQPVIFPDPDTAPGGQTVGWRAIVQRSNSSTGPWQKFDQTPLRKATAVGRFPADLLPETILLPSDVESYAFYRVSYRINWYAGNDTTIVDHAVHRPVFYGLSMPGRPSSYLSDLCESVWGLVTAGTFEGDHSLDPGPHWILDHFGPHPEFPPVTCEYDEDGQLVRIRIRRPIMFARDTGGGVQRADVAWRATIHETPQNAGTEEWTKIGQTSVSRAPATDVVWADFLPKSFNVDASVGQTAIGLRVMYRLTWYRRVTNQVTGRAIHYPRYYLLSYPNGQSSWEDDYCYMSTLN